MAVVGNPIIIGGSGGGGGGGFTPLDEGKVVSNGSLVAQTSLAITENGTYDTTLNNEVSVSVAGSGGSSYPVFDAIFDEELTGYGINMSHLYIAMSPNSSAMGQAINNYFTTFVGDDHKRHSSADKKTITLTESIATMSVSSFVNSTLFEVFAMEYQGTVYESSLINTLGLVLLGDFSQQGATSNNILSDSIANYSGVILQGIYNKNRTSSYNTSCLYKDIALNKSYWAGMKDRNNSYDCFVTFTDNQTVSLSGNRQVIIYGVP